MVKVTNIFGDKYSGKVGEAGVFANWKGRQYRRSYVKPSNPNTPAQQAVRSSFTDAVDKWHTFADLQKQAYRPLTSGMVMSGFNLFVSRWQKMTTVQRAAYVEPYIGFKQFGAGAMSAEQSTATANGTREYTLADSPLVIGETTFTKGAGALDPIAVVDILRGRIDIIKNTVGAVVIDYVSGGETVTGEAVATDPQAGETYYTDKFPLVYKSVAIKIGVTEQEAFEVDISAGKIYLCKAAAADANGTFKWKSYTPVENVKYELFKAQTQFNTHRGYSDADGIVKLAQTAEDGNRDGSIDHASYVAIVRANVSAQSAAQDEYIALTGI